MAKFNLLVHKISGAKDSVGSFETSDFNIANTELDKLWELAKAKYPNLDSLEATLELECHYESSHCNISVPLVSDENGFCLVQVRDGFIFNDEWHKLSIDKWVLAPDEDPDPLLDYTKICMRVFLFERDGPFSASPTVVFSNTASNNENNNQGEGSPNIGEDWIEYDDTSNFPESHVTLYIGWIPYDWDDGNEIICGDPDRCGVTETYAEIKEDGIHIEGEHILLSPTYTPQVWEKFSEIVNSGIGDGESYFEPEDIAECFDFLSGDEVIPNGATIVIHDEDQGSTFPNKAHQFNGHFYILYTEYYGESVEKELGITFRPHS